MNVRNVTSSRRGIVTLHSLCRCKAETNHFAGANDSRWSMKKIYGYVLSRQSNKGIANLIVTAFDSELTAEALAGHRSRYQPESMEDVWLQFGERIGSVLTDQAGRFEFNDDNCGLSEREASPNLLIAVLAPEDVLNSDDPFPLPPEKRLLYVSGLPRRYARNEEACVVRLLQAQLDKFGITVDGQRSGAEHGHDTASQYGESIERTYVFQYNLKTLIRPRLEAQLNAAKTLRTRARTNLQNLSGLSAEDRAHPQLLLDYGRLPELLKRTISDGLSTLNANASAMTLAIGDEDVKKLGLTVSTSGEVSGTVKPQHMANLLTSNIGGVDLVYRRPHSPAATAIVKSMQMHSK